MQRSALCRSRRELSNEYLLAKFGFDTAENEPFQVCPLSAYGSPRYKGGVRKELEKLDRELIGLLPVKERVQEIAALLVVDAYGGAATFKSSTHVGHWLEIPRP